MNTREFRTELEKIMPVYKWTVQRPYKGYKRFLKATGIQISGYNRTSTLLVERRVDDANQVVYKAYISGYGKCSPVVTWAKGETLVRTLRYLQTQCERSAALYKSCVSAMQWGRNRE